MTFNRWHLIGGLFIALFFSNLRQDFKLDKFDRKFSYQEIENREFTRSIGSLFYEFSDTCTWVVLDKKNMEAIGVPLIRESDGRPIEKLRLYGCMNYKDYEESK